MSVLQSCLPELCVAAPGFQACRTKMMLRTSVCRKFVMVNCSYCLPHQFYITAVPHSISVATQPTSLVNLPLPPNSFSSELNLPFGFIRPNLVQTLFFTCLMHSNLIISVTIGLLGHNMLQTLVPVTKVFYIPNPTVHFGALNNFQSSIHSITPLAPHDF